MGPCFEKSLVKGQGHCDKNKILLKEATHFKPGCVNLEDIDLIALLRTVLLV